MKVVGKYKDRDVRIISMYINETYGGYLILSDNVLERENRSILSERVKKTIERLWGDNRTVYVMDLDQIDYKKRLPRVMVYAWLLGTPIKEDQDGSHLFLVWLQDSDADPFIKAGEYFQKLEWEKMAKGYYC